MSGWGWPAGATAGGAGRTRFASGLGLSVMAPAGPLSETFCGEMLSIRQSFSTSPSDRTTDFVPFTAKIAMRRSCSITTPLSLTSGGRVSPALFEDAASGGRCVGPSRGSAISPVCAPASISVAGELRSNKGLSLLVEPGPTRIRTVATTQVARSKGGKRIIMSARRRVTGRSAGYSGTCDTSSNSTDWRWRGQAGVPFLKRPRPGFDCGHRVRARSGSPAPVAAMLAIADAPIRLRWDYSAGAPVRAQTAGSKRFRQRA